MRIEILLFITLCGCARINPQEQDYFFASRGVTHGLTPVSAPSAIPLPEKLEPDAIARGKAIYRQDCLSCHGEKGMGDGPQAKSSPRRPANLRESVRNLSDFSFYLSISQWEKTMPGWRRHYNDLERQDLAAYLKTFR